jgi:hypothetical protein
MVFFVFVPLPGCAPTSDGRRCRRAALCLTDDRRLSNVQCSCVIERVDRVKHQFTEEFEKRWVLLFALGIGLGLYRSWRNENIALQRQEYDRMPEHWSIFNFYQIFYLGLLGDESRLWLELCQGACEQKEEDRHSAKAVQKEVHQFRKRRSYSLCSLIGIYCYGTVSCLLAKKTPPNEEKE